MPALLTAHSDTALLLALGMGTVFGFWLRGAAQSLSLRIQTMRTRIRMLFTR